jgi:hypothetical protein
MENLKATTTINTKSVAQFLILASVASFLPFFFHSQWISGPIVNAILIIALFVVGIRGALVLALIPSLMALAGGLLPVILAPVIPFIMVSNVILILTIEFIYKLMKKETSGYWMGLVIAAGLKYLFLYSSVNFIVKLVLKSDIAIKVITMMSWPQFVTALFGGILAWLLLKKFKSI